MNDEVDKFLEETGKNNDPFTPESEDPFKSSVSDKKEVEEKAEDKPLPFHKDPKVQRFIEKELEKRISGLKLTSSSNIVQEVKDEMDDVLARIIGNDTPEKVSAIKDLKKVLNGLEEKGAQKALTTLQKQQEDARLEEKKAMDELNQGFESIEESYSIDLTSNAPAAKKMRTDFIDFIKRISPKDEDGEVSQLPDMNEAFALFQDMNKSKVSSKAKDLSSRSMARSSDASNAPVSGDKSWKAVDRIFSKLSS